VKVFRVTNPGGTTTVTPYATIAKPFGATYNGGSSVGVADVGEFSNSAFVKSVGDNKVEVLVGSGAGIPARVRVYDVSRPATPRVADAFSPFGPLFQGGVSLTSGRYAASGVADSVDDIVVSAGRGGASQMRVFDGTVSAAANTVLRAFTPYASLPRPNAAVFAAAVDVDGNGQIDGFRTTQGDPGASAGVAKVSVAGARTGNPLVSFAAPLRIAAARTVFATQTINGTVATPSPTAGVTAGTSRPMQIREIVTGSGATANPGNTLTVQYTGMLTNGTVFDTSRQTGRAPFQFTVGQGQVIAGWEAGLVGMKVGGRRVLEIPPELAYGDAARTNIPAKSTLVFDVELVNVTGNGTASISGTSTGALTEDGATTSVGGTLTVADPDPGQAVFASPGSLNKTYGTFSFNTVTGVWGYSIDAARPATQALKAGQVVTDSLAVTSSDGTASRSIVVTITGAGDGPTNIALTAAVVAENAPSGTVVGTLSTTDVDVGDAFTYTLVSGDGAADNAAFTIDGGVLKTAATFDFEAKSSYSIRVRSTDANGLSVDKVLTVTVTNVSEGPTDIGLSAATVAETALAGTAVGTLSTTHLDAGDTFTYALVSGAGDTDNAAFTIDGAVLKTAAAFDFETKSSYSIRVRSTVAGGLATEKTFAISVTDAAEIQFVPATPSLPENLDTSSRVKVADIVAAADAVLSLSGADAGLFEIVGTALFLKAGSTLDYETKTSYAVTVEGARSSTSRSSPVTLYYDPATGNLKLQNTTPDTLGIQSLDIITLGNGTIGAPSGNADNVGFLSGAAANLPSFTFITSNTSTTGYNGLASQAAGANVGSAALSLTGYVGWSLGSPIGSAGSFWDFGDVAVPGMTQAQVDARFLTDPELTPPTFGTSLYGQFLVSYSTNGGSFSVTTPMNIAVITTSEFSAGFTLAVTNVNEAPTDVGLSAATIPETAAIGTVVGTLFATDPDAGSSFAYALVAGDGGADNAAFTIEGTALKTAAAIDFETKSSYSIRVRATDAGGLAHEKVLTITVVGNAVATIGGTSTAALSADGSVVTVGGTLTVTDPDAGQAVFAEPDSLGGTYGTFAFVAETGQWEYTLDATRLNTLLLTSDKTVTDSLTVTSLDGTASRTIVVTITGYTMQTLSVTVATPSPSAAVPAGSTSTLRYRDYAVGSGDLADPGDYLMVNYIGRLVDGTLFDSSLLPGRDPFEFQLGAGQVIRGWDAGVAGMRVGGVRVLAIPPELAYGDAAAGSIPSGSTLLFVVEMLVATGPG
jgi:VCBS repeat-containing protein